MPRISRHICAGLVFAVALATFAVAPTAVSPGFNLFTPKQDVEIGRQSAAQVERQIPLIRTPAVESPIEAIGRRLADAAPGTKFSYQFRVTNLSDVNAFALPGGFLYVNRGLIELVPTEGQLAGVMAHEIAHVALRHPTNQVSKAYLARAGIGLLGGVLGGGNRNSASIIQAMGGLGMNALFLRFSRTAESQADIVGAQIMSRAGYDPREMADMFELLRRQAGRDPGRLERFLSDHPAPVDREARVRQEAARLSLAKGARASGELFAVKAALHSEPPPVSMKQVANVASAPPAGSVPRAGPIRIEPPSSRSKRFTQKAGVFSIDFPENWRAFEAREGYGVTIVPQGGVLETPGGEPSIVCGMLVNHYVPFEGSVDERSGAGGPLEGRSRLEDATNDLVRQTTHANPYLSVRGPVRRATFAGGPGIALELSGTSPVTGQEERVRLVTRELPDGHVLYALTIVPGSSSAALTPVLDRMVSSLRIEGGPIASRGVGRSEWMAAVTRLLTPVT
jgi:beta-barrel assembly-enhancing protease